MILFHFHFQALAGLVEIPAIAMAIFIIMCVGKKWILFSTMFCAGIACLCITFIDDHPSIQWLKITFLMLGKFCKNINLFHSNFFFLLSVILK